MSKEDFFKGFPISDLMELWRAIQSQRGASDDVSDEMMIALNEYLRQVKPADSVFAAEHSHKKPLF